MERLIDANALMENCTNYDLLRTKSVEELAEFLTDVVNDAVRKGLRVKGFLDTRYKTSLWIEWLNMECEEAKDFESWRLSEE